ncbi:MAG: DUF1273 family protein [Clostridia bacterium]|nr:DUF1273 family protein [Clostridia bacterium]
MQRIENRPRSEGKVCAFTGHRPSKYPFMADAESEDYRRLEALVLSHIIRIADEGFSHFICGLALGADMLCAMKVIQARQSLPGITLELALPCPEHSVKWRKADRQALERIKDKADIITTVCPMYTEFCMNERNKYMVECCDTLTAIFDGTRGGTWNTVKMTLDAGKHGTVIDPKTFALTEF